MWLQGAAFMQLHTSSSVLLPSSTDLWPVSSIRNVWQHRSGDMQLHRAIFMQHRDGSMPPQRVRNMTVLHTPSFVSLSSQSFALPCAPGFACTHATPCSRMPPDPPDQMQSHGSGLGAGPTIWIQAPAQGEFDIPASEEKVQRTVSFTTVLMAV